MQVEKETIVTTAPAEPAAKFILAQKRFWFALLSLVAWVVGLVYVGGSTWPDALANEKTIALVAGVISVLGLGGVYASAFKGSKSTVFSRIAEELSKQTPAPTITEIERVKTGATGSGEVLTVGPVGPSGALPTSGARDAVPLDHDPLYAPERAAEKARNSGRGSAEGGWAGVGWLAMAACVVGAVGAAVALGGCGTLGAREVEGDAVDIEVIDGVSPGSIPCTVVLWSCKAPGVGCQPVSTVYGKRFKCTVSP